MAKVFISYRGSDSYDVSRQLAAELRAEFGADNVFFDEASAPPGTTWPDSIRSAIEQAAALIVVIGPHWLHAHDEQSGRRRIDMSEDWVRQEILTFLERRQNDSHLLMLPLLVSGASMPRAEYFDNELKPLFDYQPLMLPASRGRPDFSSVKAMLKQHRFQPITAPAVVTPRLGQAPVQLTSEEESAFLSEYKHWRVIEEDKPGDSSDLMRELYRLYEFRDFETAWRFMNRVTELGIRPHDHHPRWQNTYNRVEVWLCTFNIGHKPSKRDMRLAKICESIWEELRA